MKIKIVSYSKTYQLPFASFYEKIFVQADLDEGEDARKALYECKKTVESFHYESNKAAEKQEKELPFIEGNLLNDIKTCKTLKVLESYKMLVKNKPDLQSVYDQQFKILSK